MSQVLDHADCIAETGVGTSIDSMDAMVDKPISNGPCITVFVGNISESTSNMYLYQIFSTCGAINNWKREEGANGKLQNFAFCEYSNPESAISAIRILNNIEMADTRLVVKAKDAKAREKLDEYIKGKHPNADVSSTDSSQVDQETQKEDNELLTQRVGDGI